MRKEAGPFSMVTIYLAKWERRWFMAGKTRTIKQKVTIPATPDEVYDAFMDPKKHAAFTESDAEGSSEVGGMFSAWGGYITAKNVELAKGRRIVQEWSTSEWPEGFPPLQARARPQGRA